MTELSPLPPSVRLDIWLWAARFFKTRSLAKQAIETGKISVAGQRPKSSRAVRVGQQPQGERGGGAGAGGAAAVGREGAPRGPPRRATGAAHRRTRWFPAAGAQAGQTRTAVDPRARRYRRVVSCRAPDRVRRRLGSALAAQQA